MNYFHLLYYARGVVSADDCDRIMELGLQATAAKVALPVDSQGIPADSGRKTTVGWLKEGWIYKAINPHLLQANRDAGWNFDLAITEPLQFTRYFEGDYYGWHSDQGKAPYDGIKLGKQYKGLVRKISFTLQLSDGVDYDGGDFEIAPGVPTGPSRIHTADYARERGTIIFFPSYLYHRVRRVTEGTRTSLVGWVCGPPFR